VTVSLDSGTPRTLARGILLLGATFFGFLDFVALYATPKMMAVEIAAAMAMLLAVGSSTAFFAATPACTILTPASTSPRTQDTKQLVKRTSIFDRLFDAYSNQMPNFLFKT
jgi:hypothetical protein